MTFEVEKKVVGRRRFAYIEMDLDLCALEYGETTVDGTCTASNDSNGGQKCFKTFPNCQDLENYTPRAKTYRFCENIENIPKNLNAFPFLRSITITPTKLAIGAGLGERAKVSLTLADAPHHDRGIDPYVAERDHSTMELDEKGRHKYGTFFGRFVSRNRYYRGRQLRVYTGYLVEDNKGALIYDAANFQARHYFLEQMDPPDTNGMVNVTAKDILKAADNDRAQAPRPAKGRLSAALTNSATSATLEPTGIGDLAYSASGILRINDELMDFTRAGDALTIVRGQYSSVAAAHDADDAVQECYQIGFDSAGGDALQDIVYDLLVNYANVPAAYIDKAAWDAEAATYLTRLYTALITTPIGVSQLLNELCEQGPAYLWWDEIANLIQFRALRPASSAGVELDDDSNFIAGSISTTDKQDERVSEVWMFFGQRSYTEQLADPSNFKQVVIAIGDGEGPNKHGQPKIKKVFCRWINEFGRVSAEEIADTILQRFNETPKAIKFALDPKDSSVHTGDLFIGRTRLAQDDDGLKKAITYQVIQAAERYGSERYEYEALEERYTPSETVGQRIITINNDTLDFNLREAHDGLYQAPAEAVTVLCIVETGFIVGSSSTSTPGFEVGDWPAGSDITVRVKGRIQGKGGVGGHGGLVGGSSAAGGPGAPGGAAFYTRFPTSLDLGTGAGEIWGGGGGGAGGRSGTSGGIPFPGDGGGGGQGSLPGAGGPGLTPGSNGTTEAPGDGGQTFAFPFAGDGGAAGMPGADETVPGGAVGGAAGNAIDGVSFITFADSSGDVRGPEIN